MLEVLAHLDFDETPAGYRLLTIEAPDDAPRIGLAPDELPADWRTNQAATREIGSSILDRARHLIVTVPSILVPGAWNNLINPRHPAIAGCEVINVAEGLFDPRLVR